MHEAFWASHLNRGAASGIMLGAEVDGDWRGFRCFFEPGKGRDPYTTELVSIFLSWMAIRADSLSGLVKNKVGMKIGTNSCVWPGRRNIVNESKNGVRSQVLPTRRLDSMLTRVSLHPSSLQSKPPVLLSGRIANLCQPVVSETRDWGGAGQSY